MENKKSRMEMDLKNFYLGGHLAKSSENWTVYTIWYESKTSQVSKFLDVTYGICTQFYIWPQIASRGYRRPDTRLSLNSKKFYLKKLSTGGSQFYVYLNITMIFFKFYDKFKILSDSVGCQHQQEENFVIW